MALDAGLAPARVFYCPEQFAGSQAPALLDRFAGTSAERHPVTPQVMAALSDRDGPQGIVAAFPLFAAKLADLRLSGRELVVVLDRPQDPGNLGGLIRTADAVGAAGVVILEPAVDLFDPKAIRASMGSIFNLPVVPTPDAAVLDAARGPGHPPDRRQRTRARAVGRDGPARRVRARPRQRGPGALPRRRRPHLPLGQPSHARQGRIAQRERGRRRPHVPLVAPQPLTLPANSPLVPPFGHVLRPGGVLYSV